MPPPPPHTHTMTSVAWTGTGSHLIQGSINGPKHSVAIKATHLPPPCPGPMLFSVASDDHVLGTRNLIRSWLVDAS